MNVASTLRGSSIVREEALQRGDPRKIESMRISVSGSASSKVRFRRKRSFYLRTATISLDKFYDKGGNQGNTGKVCDEFPLLNQWYLSPE